MFSFIIINFNTADLTCACLESIFKFCQPEEFEIILVDNNSAREDIGKVQERFGSRIKIIFNQENRGFAAANNQGAKLAKGNYLFFLNSDTLLHDDILAPLKSAFAADESFGILAPRLLLKNGGEQEYAYGLLKHSKAIAWVSGAALVARRTAFDSAGAWDERFFMYYEDVDLCRSVRESGYKVGRIESASVTHLRGGSPIPFVRRKTYYYRSKLLYILKHNLKLL